MNDLTNLEESKDMEKQALLLSVSSSARKENLSQGITSEDIDELAITQHITNEGSQSELVQFKPGSLRTSLTNLRMIHRKSPLSEIIVGNRSIYLFRNKGLLIY